MKIIKGLYCILPEFDTLEKYISFTRKLLKFRPNVLQLRIKKNNDKFFYQVALSIKKILTSYNDIVFIIDDRIDIALLVKADGVHLGQDDVPVRDVNKFLSEVHYKKLIIGFSTHSLQQAKQAIKMPVDYISIGPVFPTTTKEYKPVGLSVVKEVKKIVSNKTSLVAIGGINEENVILLRDIKPDAIAVISALQKNNLDKVISKLKSIF